LEIDLKARQILAGSILDPIKLKAIYTVFDGAWQIIKPSVPKNPSAQEAARLKLANIILGTELKDPINVVQLRDQAVWLYRTTTPP
jgi:hypothetical protein